MKCNRIGMRKANGEPNVTTMLQGVVAAGHEQSKGWCFKLHGQERNPPEATGLVRHRG
jgi:hypothetical protein